MRICLITSSFASSDDLSLNAGGFVLDFASLLEEHGHQVTVITPQETSVDSVIVKRFRFAINTDSLTNLNPQRFRDFGKLCILMFEGILICFNTIRKSRFDRVLCFWALPSSLIALPACVLTSTPFDTWLLGSDVWAAKKYPFGAKLLRLALKKSTNIFADGVELINEAAFATNKKIDFLVSSRKVLKISPFQNDSNSNFILYVGRYHENKGPDLLLNAYAELRKNWKSKNLSKLPNLLIHGVGPLHESLINYISENHLADFIDVQGPLSHSELALKMNRAALVVIPSRIESIPLILGQAANYARNLVVTDVGDMGDLIAKFDAGYVCKVEVDSMAYAMLNALVSPKNLSNLRSLGLHLSLENSVRKYIDSVNNTIN